MLYGQRMRGRHKGVQRKKDKVCVMEAHTRTEHTQNSRKTPTRIVVDKKVVAVTVPREQTRLWAASRLGEELATLCPRAPEGPHHQVYITQSPQTRSRDT